MVTGGGIICHDPIAIGCQNKLTGMLKNYRDAAPSLEGEGGGVRLFGLRVTTNSGCSTHYLLLGTHYLVLGTHYSVLIPILLNSFSFQLTSFSSTNGRIINFTFH
jgi:hypothetical protein